VKDGAYVVLFFLIEESLDQENSAVPITVTTSLYFLFPRYFLFGQIAVLQILNLNLSGYNKSPVWLLDILQKMWLPGAVKMQKLVRKLDELESVISLTFIVDSEPLIIRGLVSKYE